MTLAQMHADHHPIPACDGGPSTLDNLVCSCRSCNERAGARLGGQRTQGGTPSQTVTEGRLGCPSLCVRTLGVR